MHVKVSTVVKTYFYCHFIYNSLDHFANSIGFGIKQGMVHFVIQSPHISFLNIDKNNNV